MILACRSLSMRHVAVGIAVSLALLSCAANAAAQASRVGATLEGIVSDTSGAGVPNSKVTLHNPRGVSSSPIASGASGSTPLAGTGFTFGGLRSRSNNLSIDGLDNNDEYTGSSRTELSPEIVQEFQVVNNGLSAESGGASGGSINVITRSGTNTVHGDAFLFAQDGALNARDPFETESGKPSFRRFRAGFALGGPVIKDKTFYYSAVEQEHNRGQIGSDTVVRLTPSSRTATDSAIRTSGRFWLAAI